MLSFIRKSIDPLLWTLVSKATKPATHKTHNFIVNRQYCSTDETPASLYSIKKTLKVAGLEHLDDGPTCIRTECPVCEDSTKGSSVFINKTTGHFICPTCQHLTKWSIVEKFFQQPARSAKIEKELKLYRELFKEAKTAKPPISLPPEVEDISQVPAEEFTKIIEHFELESVPEQIFHLLGVKCDLSKKRLYFPLKDTTRDQIVGYRTLEKNANQIIERSSSIFGVVLLKASARAQKEPTSAILVLNLHDLLALGTQKIHADVVCLPDGLKSLPQECLPCLERYQKLVLWFNYDAAGWDVARNYARKLSEKRCQFIRPTETHPTPFKALSQGHDIKAILNKTQPILHKAITTFATLRQDVLSDLQNIDKVQGVKWTRYPTLNKLLRGHRKGELTVLTGPTGCGKTTFMSEYSLDLAMQGVTTLWGSFEIRNTRLASTLLRQLSGQPLDENLSEFDRWADEFEQLPIYFMTFHGQQAIKTVMEAIEHAQYVHDIHHVIIDNVQFMMGMSEEVKHMDRFWKQDAIVASFRTFATRKNCHVTLVIHPRKEKDTDDLTTASIFGGAKASQEADNVLIIQDKRLTSVRGKKYLQIAKNRYSGDLGIMPLEFDKNSLSYAQRPSEKKKRSTVVPAEETR